jgi:hypothetical protein
VEQHFTLTRPKFEAARAKLASEQISVVGDSGTISKSGVSVQFDYVEPDLKISVLEYGGYPHWVVNHAIAGWFR